MHAAAATFPSSAIRFRRERPRADCSAAAWKHSSPQRPRLRLGERVDLARHRSEQLDERGERHLSLGFDPARAQHEEVRSTRNRIVEERSLADARLARDDEAGRSSRARFVEHAVDRRDLALTSYKHAQSV